MHDLLAGLRVVEYARGLGAAYCGRLLADAGAEVIAVEPPGGGPVRRLGPFVHHEPGVERGLPFLHTGVNKRSVTLALDDPQGRDLFLRLLADADVLLEDAPPGVLAAHGIDADPSHARTRPSSGPRSRRSARAVSTATSPQPRSRCRRFPAGSR
jgi:crotonobetainyl-CoA:carnitine CoA-transferase CaiB-like acyl-CoA transferase